MANHEGIPPLASFSPMTAWVCRAFAFARWLSVMQWLSLIFSLFRPRTAFTQEESRSKAFLIRRMRAVETYIVAWLCLELVLAISSCVGPLPTWVRCIFGVVVTSRIVEIIQVTVNVALFDALVSRREERVASPARSLVLVGANYIELLICFGVIYTGSYANLHGVGKPITAFYLSVMTQSGVGYGDVYPIGWLRVVAATQALVGVLFVVLIFGRFIASVSPMRSVFVQDSSEGGQLEEKPAGGGGIDH